jgi:HEAT repeat protein
MHFIPKLILLTIASMTATAGFAQSSDTQSASDSEQLKIAALEALISAPPDRALPLVAKVLSGNNSDEVKSRALFILSQIDLPEAQSLLLEAASTGSGEFRLEAIRMIGIGGDAGAMAGLSEIYAGGDEEVKDSVLHAYMIADETDAVYELAANATTDEEFESAVKMLGVMGATEELRMLRDYKGNSESLIHAYAMSDDFESLRELAIDNSSPERQMQAIHGLGIVGGDEVNAALVEIYRGTDSEEIKDAAIHGMMVADYDQGLLELYRESQVMEEKRDLLRMLVMMDSDAALDVIGAALDSDQ